MDRLRLLNLTRKLPTHLHPRSRTHSHLPLHTPTSSSSYYPSRPYASLAPRPSSSGRDEIRKSGSWVHPSTPQTRGDDGRKRDDDDGRRSPPPFHRHMLSERTDRPHRDTPGTWQTSGLPPHLITQLNLHLPLALHPTPLQAEFLSAVLKGGRDVFLRERTGRGKTLALVLVALASTMKPTRTRTRTRSGGGAGGAGGGAGPTFLLLLPNTTLLAQVERWFRSFSPDAEAHADAVAEDQGVDDQGQGRGPARRRRPPGGRGVWQTIWPQSRSHPDDGQQQADAPIPKILISTPKALTDALDQPDGPPWLRTDRLRASLKMLAMDEPDAIIRPLPGRYDQQGSSSSSARPNGKDPRGAHQHPFHRHPPIGVKLLESLLPDRHGVHVDPATAAAPNRTAGRRSTNARTTQTIWTSATMNSTLRSFIVKRGWARPRGEGGVVLDYTRQMGDTGVELETEGDRVDHRCLVVDPRTGSTWDLMEPGLSGGNEINSIPSSDAISPSTHTHADAHAHTPANAPGDVHPFLIETLALLWASTPHSGKTIVIPPPGTSVPRFQAALSELECPSVSLDVDSRETAREVDEALARGFGGGGLIVEDEVELEASGGGQQLSETDESVAKSKVEQPIDQGTLLILPRTQLRGIDIQGIKTVYLLGGVGLKPTSKPIINGKESSLSTSAGTWAEREREYLHWVGRMSRLSGTVDTADSQTDEQPDRMISIVLDGPEVAVMRKLLGGRNRNAVDGEQSLPSTEKPAE